MMPKTYLQYIGILECIEEIPANVREEFAGELYRRHVGKWALPVSTYRRCKKLLFQKKTSERSPYYYDLFKIENKDNLKVVLIDIYNTMRVRFNVER